MNNLMSLELYNKKKQNKLKLRFLTELSKNGQLYIMTLPAIALLFLFNYLPLFGLVLAFKNFTSDKGIFGSDWVNPIFSNFQFLLSSSQSLRAIQNTLLLNILFIVIGTVVTITFTFLLNEIQNKWAKKLFQTLTFFPFFVSWVVVGVFTYNLFNFDYGSINRLLLSFGMGKVDWYSYPEAWPAILVIINIWKGLGYGSVIYLATLAGIDSTYYEAAEIDGASKFQQIKYISLPMLKPTIIILTLLSVGRVMNADFGMFFNTVGNAALLYPTTDVIDTFVYRALRVTGDIGMASATGFFQSIISFILVTVSNLVVRRIDEDSSLF